MSENQIRTAPGRVSQRPGGLPERRQHARSEVTASVLIYWLDEHRMPYEAEAVLCNFSARGFGVLTDRRFDTGDLVTIRTPDRSLTCVVRHVQERKPQSLIGLEILSASDGSTIERSLAMLSTALHQKTEKQKRKTENAG